MKQRVISVIVLLAIIAACMPWEISRVLFFGICGCLCVYEYAKCLRGIGITITRWVLFAFLGAMAVLTITRCGFMAYLAWTVFAVFIALFSGILHQNVAGQGAIYTVSALAYPCLPFAMMMIISVSDRWLETILLACFSTWMCDAFALFGGMKFGKHKLAPHVSPNKTIEGALIGAVFSLVGGLLCWIILKMPLHICLITAFVASSLGQIGDLAESLLKRYIGVKDFGNLIPGHGGMFDRADSLMFSIPTAYFCLYIFGF